MSNATESNSGIPEANVTVPTAVTASSDSSLPPASTATAEPPRQPEAKIEAAANDAALAPDIDETEVSETCPKCHTSEPWGSSSWCPMCGYYPGVTESCPQSAEHVDAAAYAEESDSAADKPVIASWLMQIIWINTGLYVAAIAARYYFVYFDNSFRGLTGLAVLILGFLTVAFNHIRSSMDAMQKNVELSPFDIVGSPGEMWRTTISGLPKTAGRIVWATVGFSGMICGGLVIGGIDLSGMFAHDEPAAKKPDVLKKIVSTAVANKPEENQPETLEEALEQVTTLEEVAAVPMPEPGTAVTCVVYGFMKDGQEDFGRILLAAEIGGKRRHVATMPASAFPASSREILASRLQPLITEQASVETQYRGATWVRPTVGLRIEFSGWSVLGEMNDPTLAKRRPAASPAPLEPNR